MFPNLTFNRSEQLDNLLESIWELQDMHRELIRETERLVEVLSLEA